jgi:hypothetical protein
LYDFVDINFSRIRIARQPGEFGEFSIDSGFPKVHQHVGCHDSYGGVEWSKGIQNVFFSKGFVD